MGQRDPQGQGCFNKERFSALCVVRMFRRSLVGSVKRLADSRNKLSGGSGVQLWPAGMWLASWANRAKGCGGASAAITRQLLPPSKHEQHRRLAAEVTCSPGEAHPSDSKSGHGGRSFAILRAAHVPNVSLVCFNLARLAQIPVHEWDAVTSNPCLP